MDAAHRMLGRQPTSAQLGRDPTFPSATTAAAFPPSVSDVLDLDALLTPEERAIRQRVRKYMVRPKSDCAVCLYWVRLARIRHRREVG
jgi:hypothetical protein